MTLLSWCVVAVFVLAALWPVDARIRKRRYGHLMWNEWKNRYDKLQKINPPTLKYGAAPISIKSRINNVRRIRGTGTEG